MLKNIFNLILIMLSRFIPKFAFASSAEISQRTFGIFTDRYTANVEAFKKKVGQTSSQAESIKRSTQRAYVHPLHEKHKPVFLGVGNAVRTDSELRGPEQVSAHYEHFSMARRQALIFLGGLIALRFIASTEDFFMFGQSGTYAWTFYFAYNYFWIQGKKYFLMPFLSRFYRKLLNMEVANVQTYWAENTEARIRNLMSTAKEQIQYKSVHSDYLNIRNNALLSFLIQEQVALKNHLFNRAENILKEVENTESINQDKIISSVMKETLTSIDTAYSNNKEQIESAMFDLALQGIANGRMDYAKDPILPHVIQTINKTVDRFGKISKEEQDKMVALTEDQLNNIRSGDVRARDEYIKTEPKIEGSLRNNPTVSKVLSGWGQ